MHLADSAGPRPTSKKFISPRSKRTERDDDGAPARIQKGPHGCGAWRVMYVCMCTREHPDRACSEAGGRGACGHERSRGGVVPRAGRYQCYQNEDEDEDENPVARTT